MRVLHCIYDDPRNPWVGGVDGVEPAPPWTYPSPGTGEGGGSQAAGWGPSRSQPSACHTHEKSPSPACGGGVGEGACRVRDASAKRRDPRQFAGLASVTHSFIVRYGAAARPRASGGTP